MKNTINLNHGFGGEDSNKLINDLIFKILYNNCDNLNGNDCAVINGSEKLAISTDSFVVSPIFFGEKSIGHLCVAGSVNDVLTCGSVPKYLTLSLVIEEGFSIEKLEKILYDIKEEANKNQVIVVTGDTKVVPKGNCDGIYINTACVGYVKKNYNPSNIEIGDKIILTGNVGDHEAALTILRNKLPFESNIKSDVSGLGEILVPLLEKEYNIKAMRDPTRGGLAATLNELTRQSHRSFLINEKDIPVNEEVKAFCEIIGLDKYIFASEGKMIIFVSNEDANNIINYLHKTKLGKNAKIIGEVIENDNHKVFLKTLIGKRILPMPSKSQLPRIC